MAKKTYTYEWASGSWENRAALDYVPVDQKNCGCECNIPAQGFFIPAARMPCKVEDTGAGVIYMTYTSLGRGAIIRITETEG